MSSISNGFESIQFLSSKLAQKYNVSPVTSDVSIMTTAMTINNAAATTTPATNAATSNNNTFIVQGELPVFCSI